VANRLIKARVPGGAAQLLDCLASLLALELMAPGGRLYLISPRCSDMTIIASPFGQFRAVMPMLGQTELRLSDALGSLANRGSLVRLLYRPGDPQTESFIGRLPSAVERQGVTRLEERALIGETFYLRGSLEFSMGGIAIGDESVELTTEADQVAQAMLEAEQLWRRS
jgi:hypothetical protein